MADRSDRIRTLRAAFDDFPTAYEARPTFTIDYSRAGGGGANGINTLHSSHFEYAHGEAAWWAEHLGGATIQRTHGIWGGTAEDGYRLTIQGEDEAAEAVELLRNLRHPQTGAPLFEYLHVTRYGGGGTARVGAVEVRYVRINDIDAWRRGEVD